MWFVIEDGILYFVQYRDLRLSLPAKLAIITEELKREFQSLDQNEKLLLLRKLLDFHILFDLGEKFTSDSISLSNENENSENFPRIIAKGQPIGGRAQTGLIARNLKQAEKILKEGKDVVLVLEKLEEASTILHLNNSYKNAISVVTYDGSPSSHAAYLLGTENIAGVIGCGNISEYILNFKGYLSVDGVNGEVHLGELTVTEYSLDEDVKRFVELRKDMGVSTWESIVYRFGLEDKLYNLEEKIEKIINNFTNGLGAKSPKALTQQIINDIFPREFLTEYHIVSLLSAEEAEEENDYKTEIASKVREGWKKGYDVSVRSAYLFSIDDSAKKLGINPWIIFKPGEEAKLDNFLNGELPNWKYGSLNKWKRNETENTKLTEVLVGYNHSGKLDEKLASQHAVGIVKGAIGLKNKVAGSLILDTPHLRSYEESQYQADNIISYKINFDQNEVKLILGFGKNHINLTEVTRLIEKLFYDKSADLLSPEEKAVRKDILLRLGVDEFSQFKEFKFTVDECADELIKIIEEGDLSNNLLEQLITKRSWSRVYQITNKLINNYIIAVAPGIAAVENWLSRQTGDFAEVTIEFQIGFNNSSEENEEDENLNWMTIYGIKGLEELLLKLEISASDREVS